MPAIVELTGVSITKVERTGAIGQAVYSGTVEFHIATDAFEFSFAYAFPRASDIDTMVDGAAQILAKNLDDLAQAARKFVPGR
jgi:hypothetical protein